MNSENRFKLEIILVSSSLLLLAAAFSFPQYQIKSYSGSDTTVTRYYLFDWTYAGSDTFAGYYEETSARYDLKYVMAVESFMVGLTLFLAWILMVLTVLRLQTGSAILSWFTMSCSIITVVWPFSFLPVALDSDVGFFGTSLSEDIRSSLGPSSGWYVLLIVCLVVSSVGIGRMAEYFSTDHPKKEKEWPVAGLPKE